MKLFSKPAVNTDPEAIRSLLERAVDEVIDADSLRKKLSSGKQLRIKLGIDPTSPNIHIGRAIPLRKLRDFQRLGHQIIFLIGDFTGVIGDTSDKDAERPMLSAEVVKKNMASYAKQAAKILDISKVEVVYNSTWLKKLSYADICEQAEAFSVNEFVSRELIAKRLEEGKRVSLREVLYPLMQGYDSVALKADVELGGTDQRFNLLAGRTLQRKYGQEPQDIITNPLIEGTDGRKMSSSWGNVINVTDEPNDMFGKVMSLRDELIVRYFIFCTDVSDQEIKITEQNLASGANPRDAKLKLAQALVALYHGESAADAAYANFINTFSKGEIPEDITEVSVTSQTKLIDALVEAQIISSKTEARRLFEAGAIKCIDGEERKMTNPEELIIDPLTLRVGKHRFIRLLIRN